MPANTTDKKQDYYSSNAQEFFDSTVAVDVTELHRPFLTALSRVQKNRKNEQLRILDAGCGSGRDALAFSKMGFDVEAFDGCEELAQKATELLGKPVATATFMSFNTDVPFDGIWACASLLHVPPAELKDTFIHLASMLADDGVFYCSFKYGDGEMERQGRRFTNLTEEGLKKVLTGTALTVSDSWVSSDVRAGRSDEKWLNAILTKQGR